MGHIKYFIGHIRYIEQAIQWTEKKTAKYVCTSKETYGPDGFFKLYFPACGKVLAELCRGGRRE